MHGRCAVASVCVCVCALCWRHFCPGVTTHSQCVTSYRKFDCSCVDSTAGCIRSPTSQLQASSLETTRSASTLDLPLQLLGGMQRLLIRYYQSLVLCYGELAGRGIAISGRHGRPLQNVWPTWLQLGVSINTCKHPLPRRGDPMLLAWLARSHVRAGQPAAAWALCSDAVNRSGGGTNDTSALLRLVGEECYRSGAFLHALRVMWGPVKAACAHV